MIIESMILGLATVTFTKAIPMYRVTHQNGKNLPLT